MLKNAIKSNYWGGHFAKSGPKNGGGGARRRRNFFPAESVWGKIVGPREEYTPVYLYTTHT